MSKNKNTAIYRKKPSRPMRWLSKHGRLNCKRKLDYGSGRGFDADYYHMDKYDPNWSPSRPNGKYDVITCNFVLNVVEIGEQIKIIEDVINHLTRNGTAYFSVRRDLKKDEQKNGYPQRLVYLNLPSIYNTRDYEIYMYKKGESYV